MKVILFSIASLVIIVHFAVQFFCWFRLWYLEKLIVKCERLYSNIKSIHDMCINNHEASDVFYKKIEGDESLSSAMRDMLLSRVHNRQEELHELERMSDFEPQKWWPEKHRTKLKTLKDRARTVLLNARSLK